MTVMYDASSRAWSEHSQSHSALCLEDKLEVIKEIGDGSFGSVSLARVRTAGSHIARRGTMVAVKTMKKTFDTFNHCLELREVIFLRSLPNHPHLVPALDIFLDPISKKLHIAMEYMDGNLYQLMKARDHKYLDCNAVKSILFQIISGLEHIHNHHFFHRDIKPENILVSTSSPQDSGSAFRRYSALMTPPSTPPTYTIKIADFGLARETHSKLPYTTYVSTRWYRAPEVLLRAGEYSAPVDIWAIGAMAVEIATLKPLFPGGNEVDQVWRICEIMGSPGGWINKHGAKVGGGEWKDGVKLAHKLGFSFPKMAPHSLETILRPPQWPESLSQFVTWCLMWDPKARPTAAQALAHDYFKDAVDPLRPKSSSRLLGRKQSNISTVDSFKESNEFLPMLSSKTSSWFRKSIQREVSAPAVPQHPPTIAPTSNRPVAVQPSSMEPANAMQTRPNANKRATWANGLPANAAPMPILPSIRPVSPLSDAVHAQATVGRRQADDKKKIGRQLSVNSNTNHYSDAHRQEAERALNGHGGLASPTSAHKEGFFSHLRKRARRFSGRYQTPISPNDDIEANAGCAPWGNRQGGADNSLPPIPNASSTDFTELDKALQNVRSSLEGQSHVATPPPKVPPKGPNNSMLKRHHSVGNGQNQARRLAARQQSHTNLHYDTPDEEEELLNEALNSARKAARRLDSKPVENLYQIPARPPPMVPSMPYHQNQLPQNMYLTPSPSANRNSVNFGQYGSVDQMNTSSKPMDITKPRNPLNDFTSKWPTPPYEESDWGMTAAASILAASAAYR